jgi:hypothetical protein
MRTRNDVDTYQFADTPGSRCSRVGRSFHGRDVASDDCRHESGTDFFIADKLHIRGFDHRIGGLDHSDKPLAFDHS